MGLLYICATPIGNLGDASPRLIEVLREADFIIAEDTRSAGLMFSRFGIKKSPGSIASYQDYNSPARTAFILDRIKHSGVSALISESGVPAIQDPGYRIIRSCIDSGIDVRVIPGPNAAVSALVLSGLPTDSFLFAGFLPKTAAKRKEKIAELGMLPCTLIFYESPLRIKKLLAELMEGIGDRNACIAREMTKVFEETIRGKFSEILSLLGSNPVKGEIVLVVEGLKNKSLADFDEAAIKKEYINLKKKGLADRDIFKIIRSKYAISRQRLYNITKISK